ncbi:MAG TPA: hypothetical protein VKU00_14430 [Chthonomonadaceae bacterium]|nr:hypothetical protein [Chthonomonadaceae bacterium]
MNTDSWIVPLTRFSPACLRFLGQQSDGPGTSRERLVALTMVHTIMVYGVFFQESRQRKKAWFPRRSRRKDLPLCVRISANATGQVQIKDSRALPLTLVWEAAIALYGLEAVSPVEENGFTVRLLAGTPP